MEMVKNVMKESNRNYGKTRAKGWTFTSWKELQCVEIFSSVNMCFILPPEITTKTNTLSRSLTAYYATRCAF